MLYQPKHLERWSRPESWGQLVDDWFYTRACFQFMGQNRDSDALERSNFTCALALLGGESDTVKVIREGHWAVGWIEWIAIHESDESALRIAEDIACGLEDYPVVNEDHWSELEFEEACEYWEQMSVAERSHYCRQANISIFAARRDYLPEDPQGLLLECLR